MHFFLILKFCPKAKTTTHFFCESCNLKHLDVHLKILDTIITEIFYFHSSTNIGFYFCGTKICFSNLHSVFFVFHYLKAAIYLDLSASRGNLTCVDVGWLRPCCDVISGKIMKCLPEPSGMVHCSARQGALIAALQCI